MSYDRDEYQRFESSVGRYKNAQLEPDTFGFDDRETLAKIEEALGIARRNPGAKLLFKRGLDADGNHEGWVLVKSGSTLLYVGNVSYTCPPRPPEDCEQ
jgi:hypothetical protein